MERLAIGTSGAVVAEAQPAKRIVTERRTQRPAAFEASRDADPEPRAITAIDRAASSESRFSV